MTARTMRYEQKPCGTIKIKPLAVFLLPSALLLSFIVEPKLLYASFALAATFAYGALLNIFVFRRGAETYRMLNIVLEKIFNVM